MAAPTSSPGTSSTSRGGAAPWSAAEEPALTARSVIASTLLGVRPPHLSTRVLVGACGLFGIADGTARVAISRMVSAGELAPRDGGYGLTGPLLERSARQDASARATTRRWDPGDRWAMAVVVAEARTAADRTALRRAATSRRLAELREGVWLRPDNLPSIVEGAAPPGDAGTRGGDPSGDTAGSGDPSETVLTEQCRLFTAVPEGDPGALAATLWDLDGWAQRATRLLAALERTRDALGSGDRAALPEAFVLSAAVLRHLQADPLLPDALLPAGWPGRSLRATHDAWRTSFEATWRTWARDAG